MKTEDKKMHRPSLRNGLWINDTEFNVRVTLVIMAAEILMAFSPFGFIILPKISMTTLFIGVLIGALWGGPISGAAVGLVFGLCSMWKASVTAVNANDLIFSPLYSGDPVGSVILSLAPRILYGIIAGLVYYAVMRWIPKKIRIPGVMLLSAVLERVQSMLTYLFMDKVFHVEGASMWKAFNNLFSAKRLKEYGLVMLIMLCVYLLYSLHISGKYYAQFRKIGRRSMSAHIRYIIMVICAIAVICLTASHLWDRMQIILYDIDHFLPEEVNSDRMVQVIMQFIAAAFSALYIVSAIYRHSKSTEEYERQETRLQLEIEKERARELEKHTLIDPLTGAYNRKGLEEVTKEEKLDQIPISYLLLDIDHFKQANDTYGHDIGDAVLKAIAESLSDAFGKKRVFRIGGDEFAVLISGDLSEMWDEVCHKFERIHRKNYGILPQGLKISLSVGGCYSANGYNSGLYPLADMALYETKRNGRAGCTLVDEHYKILRQWKDTCAENYMKSTFEMSNTGIGRLEFSEKGDIKPRLFCNETARYLLGISDNASPEECYEIWRDGMDPSFRDALPAAEKRLMAGEYIAYTYTWNHPHSGKLLVRSGGAGEVKDGLVSALGYHQLVSQSNMRSAETEQNQ